jgi:hypothetical protein
MRGCNVSNIMIMPAIMIMPVITIMTMTNKASATAGAVPGCIVTPHYGGLAIASRQETLAPGCGLDLSLCPWPSAWAVVRFLRKMQAHLAGSTGPLA